MRLFPAFRFAILTGFGLLHSEHSQYAILPFPLCDGVFLLTGGTLDIHSWHRLGMWFIAAFIAGHAYGDS